MHRALSQETKRPIALTKQLFYLKYMMFLSRFLPLVQVFQARLCSFHRGVLSLSSYGQGVASIETLPIGPETGLVLPRFVSIDVDSARMRQQPSTEHTILYIYLRVGLPMRVLNEEGSGDMLRIMKESRAGCIAVFYPAIGCFAL